MVSTAFMGMGGSLARRMTSSTWASSTWFRPQKTNIRSGTGLTSEASSRGSPLPSASSARVR